MEKKTLDIKGMHCKSCEVLLENELKNVSGVHKVKASTKNGTVQLLYSDNLDINDVSGRVEKLGYSLGKNGLPLVNLNADSSKQLITAVFILLAVWLFAKAFKLDSLLNVGGSNNASLPLVFMIGITAGFSTCMAIVGGLVLGISTRYAEKHLNASTKSKFTPHIYFNIGRVLSYTLLGGLIGLLGSSLKLPTGFQGILGVVIGIYMLFLGAQILDIFPRISAIAFMPKFLSKKIVSQEKEYSHLNSMLLGASTFFLPCGFTQAMQVYAVTTGRFVTGALIMGVFALGTTPGLLAIGGIVSNLKKGYYSQLLFKIIGMLIIVLSLYNIVNGYNLSGFKLGLPEKKTTNSSEKYSENVVTESNGVQLIKATYSPNSQYLTPDKLTVKAGKPVRFEVYAEEDGVGCMGSVMIPGLANQPQFYKKGEVAVFQFTPKKAGKYRVTCAMGVPSAEITVE
jgi:sulfite exporter TauE/SafE/copper chaperone CopZ